MKTNVVDPKEYTKFGVEESILPQLDQDLSLQHVQIEMARIDDLLRAAINRWREAGRDPSDAFRGLIVTDEEAEGLISLPFASTWGDYVANQSDPLVHVYRHAQERVADRAERIAPVGRAGRTDAATSLPSASLWP